MPTHVEFTPRALALAKTLHERFGPLIFHLSGGCCEGTAPMCFRARDFLVGPLDVWLDDIDGTPFYVASAQFDYLADTLLTIDVTDGGGDSFSLEAADGQRFTARSTTRARPRGAASTRRTVDDVAVGAETNGRAGSRGHDGGSGDAS